MKHDISKHLSHVGTCYNLIWYLTDCFTVPTSDLSCVWWTFKLAKPAKGICHLFFDLCALIERWAFDSYLTQNSICWYNNVYFLHSGPGTLGIWRSIVPWMLIWHWMTRNQLPGKINMNHCHHVRTMCTFQALMISSQMKIPSAVPPTLLLLQKGMILIFI